MLSLDTYEKYFEEEIVGRFSKLNGFYAVDMFEFDSFLNDLRSGTIKTPALILESYQTGTTEARHGNFHNDIKGALVILGSFDARKKSPTEKRSFLAEMESIAMQVRARILKDSEKNCHLISGLQAESIFIAKTEVIAGGFQGYRMEFNILDTDETELSEDWS